MLQEKSQLTTQKQVREEFWKQHPEWFFKYYKSRKRQNDYPANVRLHFVDFVEYLHQMGMISDNLAQKVTL